MRRAVSATMVFICSRLGTGEAFSRALFWLAELTTAAGYVKPRKVLGTSGVTVAAGGVAAGAMDAPGSASFWPG